MDGDIRTRLWSKPSDTHAYLPPTSCHPYHICKNNPDQVARRVRKLSHCDNDYFQARKEYSNHLQKRGYSAKAVEESFTKFDNVKPKSLYNKNTNNNKDTGRNFPLITEYNPHLPQVNPIINKYKHILEMDPELCKVIPPTSIFTSFRQPKNIKDTLIHSRFISSPDNTENPTLGCVKCGGKCDLCNNFLIQTKTVKSYHCNETYQIKHKLGCKNKGVIYLLNDNICKRSYVGSTTNSMSERLSTYKNHIKTRYKGCEIALHFKDEPSLHSSPTETTGPNLRNSLDKRVAQQNYTEFLKSQLSIVIIDSVELSDCTTRAEKRDKIARVEGYGRTQLRTMQRYGGLNKKDERKIANNKNAKG